MKRFWWLLALTGTSLILLHGCEECHATELPYVVKIGPQGCVDTLHKTPRPCFEIKKGDYFIWDCTDKETCEDLAAALNEAHERRMKEIVSVDIDKDSITRNYADGSSKKEIWKYSKKAEWEAVVTTGNPPGSHPITDEDWAQFYKQGHVTNKEACGQDDCGADPK